MVSIFDFTETSMYLCCKRIPDFIEEEEKTKFSRRQKGDLSISYDVTQAYDNNYLAQVTIDNHNPLGRLDHWNLTWEWMRGEFIFTMKGAYTRTIDHMGCIYGPPGQYYQQMDFSKVVNCEKKPIISDLPKEKENDTEVGKIPHCCRNGTMLPTLMDATQSKSAFQMQVFKIKPDLNRTALYPPERFKIVGDLNPNYKCGPPVRVEPARFPDPSGLQASSLAIASWQVICNISRPTKGKARCCLSFSAYYNESVVPCNTCACGCKNTRKCNPRAPAMLLPPEALLVPFENRTSKTIAWAALKHLHAPKPLPCGDNCGVSVNWHVSSDYRDGWAARITLFNWQNINFEDWFAAVQLKKASIGYENVYSFNGTLLTEMNRTLFLQGIEGTNYLIGMSMNKTDPKKTVGIPGKVQSMISFKKKDTPGINIAKGDGFPSRFYFNGEECELPTRFPIGNGNRCFVNMVQVVILIFVPYFFNQIGFYY